MKTKLIVLSVFFFLALNFKSQDCGTTPPPGYVAQLLSLTSSLGTTFPQDTCLHKELSVVFHVVLDSNYQQGISPADLTTCINTLNQYFKPICISFKSCSTNYVSNYNYNKWDKQIHEPAMFTNYYVDSTINIYLVSTIVTPPGVSGYAHMPGEKDAIVITKASLINLTPVHQMGHFLGILDTYEKTGGSELVKRTNCYTSGDGFCDTEADPCPTGMNLNMPCNYAYGPVDANGKYYTPPVDNIMTSFLPCRCRFTQEQYNFMAYKYRTARAYLH